VPQFGHGRISGPPHSSQNLACGRFSCWHRGTQHMGASLVCHDGPRSGWGPTTAPPSGSSSHFPHIPFVLSSSNSSSVT